MEVESDDAFGVASHFNQRVRELHEIIHDLTVKRWILDVVDVTEGGQHSSPKDDGDVGQPTSNATAGHHRPLLRRIIRIYGM
jgi:hypothetical protein